MVSRVALTVYLTLAISASLTAGAEAMDRFYCVVDDAQLKLTIEAGFIEEPGWPLGNLRGVVVFKPGHGAAGLGTTGQGTKAQARTVKGAVRLAMPDMVLAKRDNRNFQLRTSSTSGADEEAMDVTMLFNASMVGDDINRFAGTYAVTVRPQGNANPAAAVEQDGLLSCKRF